MALTEKKKKINQMETHPPWETDHTISGILSMSTYLNYHVYVLT